MNNKTHEKMWKEYKDSSLEINVKKNKGRIAALYLYQVVTTIY